MDNPLSHLFIKASGLKRSYSGNGTEIFETCRFNSWQITLDELIFKEAGQGPASVS